MTESAGAAVPAWLRALDGATVVSGAPGDVSDVTHDSRRVRPGGLFVAIPGAKADGNDFIPPAIASGAAAVIVQTDRRERWQPHVAPGVAFVAVPDARAALAQAAAGLFGFPARTLGMVGVTGTDGKTTTTHLVAHVLTAKGRRAGYLSSVEFSDGAAVELNASHMTTLEASDVQRQLRRIADAGARYAGVEASSIGLELHRLDECAFDVAVFTNLTPDHLDFHGTMDAYLASKRRLFEMLAASPDKGIAKAAVLNADDPASAAMRQAASGVRAITYALKSAADLTASAIARDPEGTAFVVHADKVQIAAKTPLLGAYNVANCLAAVAVAVSQGAALDEAAAMLATFPGVPGRMERIDEGQPFRVIVDIASTEPAMRNVLGALRPATDGRIVVVFGAAGERDPGRRSGIARAVAERADFAVIANEDPRSEDPDAIIAEIADALAAAGWRDRAQFERIPDRREAIRRAFELARDGDTVLLAGKGTEQAIDMADGPAPWDERRVARELLRAIAGV